MGKSSRFDSKAQKHKQKRRAEGISPTDPSHRVRLVIDLTSLNRAGLDPTKITLPTVQDVETRFRRSYVSVIDLSQAYFSIGLDAESEDFFQFFIPGSDDRHLSFRV